MSKPHSRRRLQNQRLNALSAMHLLRTAMSFNAYVCPQCDEHLRMKARDRLNWFFDQVQTELGQEFKAKESLKFVDSKPYPARMVKHRPKQVKLKPWW
jgi:acetyl-CoA carboxylase beta subunit